MSLTSSIFLIITVFLIYYVLIHIYTLFLRVTGLTKEKARFQSISLLTNAGFTTSESEIITLERRRRAIAKSAMLIGYFFSVVFVSLVINLFLSIDFTKMDELIPLFSLSFGGLILFLILLNLPPVRKHQERLIEKITVRLLRRAAKENYISVLDSYGEDNAVCKVYLYKVPELLDSKRICDTQLKNLYSINILMYERKGQVRHVTASTIFSSNDILLMFGPLTNIQKAFLLHDSSEKQSMDDKKSLVLRNDISIIDNYDYQVLAEIVLNKVPDILKDTSLISSNLRKFFSINVMMVSRSGKPITLTKDTILQKDDKVIAFGPLENIYTLFGERASNQL